VSGWLRASLPRALAIVLFGIGAGLAANQVSPRGLPLITPPRQTQKAEAFIALDQAKELWHRSAALFLDAREPADYAAGHIGNALNLPAQSFAQHFGEIAPLLTRESPLVLYCDGPECDLSHRLSESLRQLGYTNLHILSNGWTAWRQAGLPTTPGGQK
jgi:rhodanese-related sulfurtransferase